MFPIARYAVNECKFLPHCIKTLIHKLFIRHKEILKQLLNLVSDPQRQRVNFQPDISKLLQRISKVILYSFEPIPQGAGDLSPNIIKPLSDTGA